MVNVHCSGGLRMMAACREELAKRSGPQPLLIGVTVLTSMEREDLADIGLDVDPQEQVLRLAALAQKAGMDGLVCSALEAPAFEGGAPRAAVGDPGIRPRVARRMTSAASSPRAKRWMPARITW